MKQMFAYSPDTNEQKIPAIISAEFLATLRDHGVLEAHLFGSIAVGTADADSDIDLLVTFARPIPLFAQLRLADHLRRICGRPVDLMIDIHPAFAPYILPTLVPLPV